MKKDMSKHREHVNGQVNYKHDKICNGIDHRLKIRELCESRDGSGGDCRSTSGVVTTRDAQNQTCDNAYVRMTIKSIIKEKITEMQAFDTGQLQTKLIRMEEENFNLRNRAIVLEERITFLEKKGVVTLIDTTPLPPQRQSTPSQEEHGDTERVANFDFSRKVKPDVTTTSANQIPFTIQSTKSTVRSNTTPVSPPVEAHAASTGKCAITRPSVDIGCNNTGSPRPNEALPSTAELPSQTREVSSVNEIPSATTDFVTTEVPVSPGKGKTYLSDLPSSTQEINSVMSELPKSTRDTTSEFQNVTRMPNNATPVLSSNGTNRQRNKQTPSPRRRVSISLDTPTKYRDSLTKNSSNSSDPLVLTGNRPIPSIGASLHKPNHYERRELQNHHEHKNCKVRMYENQLLGEISPNALRIPMETRGQTDTDFIREQDLRERTDNSFPREMEKTRKNPEKDNYNSDESHPASYFSTFNSMSQIPRSISESSIFSTNIPRNDREYNYASNNQNTFKLNDVRIAENPRTAREFRHNEMPPSNETKIEKMHDAYHSMPNIAESYTFSSSNDIYDPNMELQRYDTNNFPTNTLSKISLKRPATLSTYSGARVDSRPMEYEPLSKVSPKPPSLILNPSPNRYPVRLVNIPRAPVARPNYPVTRPNYPNTTPNYPNTTPNYPNTTPNYPNTTPNYPNTTPNYPNTTPNYPNTTPNYPNTTPNYPNTPIYNVSATNFHATSRTADHYSVSNPNPSPNYQDSYDKRLALPQLIAHITSDKSSIIFTWDKVNNSQMFVENVDVYVLFAFHTLDLNQPPPKELSYWKRISIVNPLPLPIACTLTQSFDGQNYFFAVAAVNIAGRVGQLSNPCALKVAL